LAAVAFDQAASGAVLLSANYRIHAQAHDLQVSNTGKQVLATGGVALDPDPGPYIFEPEARADHGDASTIVRAKARAQVGSIGVGLSGTVATDILAEGEARGDYVNAGWLEFIVPRVRNKPVGQAIVFNTLLVVDGNLSALVGAGTLNRFGVAQAHLRIEEDGTNAVFPTPPILGVFWAELRTDPINGDVVVLPPAIIRVRHTMSNGMSYTLGNRMNLDGVGRGADGGSSSFTADFSGSMKWGGVESVTDTAGNPIPTEDWMIESESGFDYARSFESQIPEPTSGALLMLALYKRLMPRRGRQSNHSQ
jgi:hypothetical protein